MNAITMPTALTMSSREIADLLGKELSHVNRDIRRMISHLQDDPELDHVREEQDGRGYTTAFHIGRELTFTLLTGYNVWLRRRVIARWQELEARHPAPAQLTRLDILKLAMASEQARIEAEAQLALAAPKVEFVDRYVQPSTGSMGVREVCKLLGAKLNAFTDFLLKRGLMYRTTPQGPLTPRAEHMHNGRFEAKTGTAEHGETSHAFVHYKFTAKGVEWIAGLWCQHQVREKMSSEVAA